MNGFCYEIVPYHPEFEPQLKALEMESFQGTKIQLEMRRPSFLSRSVVFDQYQIFLALTPDDQLMGVLAASIIPLQRNGKEYKFGLCYDVRVGKKFRGNGLTKILGRYAADHFYWPHQVDGIYMTMKSTNHAVYKSAKILGLKLHSYPFEYLTIPVNANFHQVKSVKVDTQFSVNLLSNEENLGGFVQPIEGGHFLWHTHHMYQIRIRKLHWTVGLGIHLMNTFKSPQNKIPIEGDELRFSLFCAQPITDRLELVPILDLLQKAGVNYLIVVCKKNSELYRTLKPKAINAYPYLLVSTFPIHENDELVVDARCF